MAFTDKRGIHNYEVCTPRKYTPVLYSKRRGPDEGAHLVGHLQSLALLTRALGVDFPLLLEVGLSRLQPSNGNVGMAKNTRPLLGLRHAIYTTVSSIQWLNIHTSPKKRL